MTVQYASNGRVFRCAQGGNTPMRSRVVMSEVQITGLPKASMLEVASTA
jgi:hypothetical protein